MSKFHIDPTQVNLDKLIPILINDPTRDFIIYQYSDYKQDIYLDLPAAHITQKQEYLVAGGAGNDTFLMDRFNDTVDGGKGNDYLEGNGGNDILYGNDGNDSIYGGAGNDLLRGGNGNDVLVGGMGDDTIFGGNGDDRAVLDGGGKDVVYMGDGNDSVSAVSKSTPADISLGNGDDYAFISSANASVDGGAGHDYIYAGNKGIVAKGGAGNDTLEATRAYIDNDYLSGKITTPDLSTRLTGGAGADTFVFNFNTAATITDFVHGQDKIDLSNMADIIGTFKFNQLAFEHQNGNLIGHLNVNVVIEQEHLTGPTFMLEHFSGNLVASDFDLVGFSY